MTIFYVTTGAWGTGTGTPNTAAQVDGNFYDVDQRIVSLDAELADGKIMRASLIPKTVSRCISPTAPRKSFRCRSLPCNSSANG